MMSLMLIRLLMSKDGYRRLIRTVTLLTEYQVINHYIKSLYYLFSFYFVHLVGNKNDSPDKKVVSTDDAQKFAEQIGVELYESSAKENINVEEVHSVYTWIDSITIEMPLQVFYAITRLVLKTKKESAKEGGGVRDRDTIKVNKSAKSKKKSGCC